MEVYSCLNEGIFATVTIKLKEELWFVNRGHLLLRHLALLGRIKGSKLVPLDIVHQGMPMMSLNKTSCWSSRLKQGEMCKSTKYKEWIKHYQEFLEGKQPNKICNEEAKIQLAIPCDDYMQQLSFDRSIDDCNFCFRKKNMLLVIDNKTNNLNNKITPKRINQLWT